MTSQSESLSERFALLKAAYEATHPTLAKTIPFKSLSRMSWYSPGKADEEAAKEMHAYSREVFERAWRKCHEEFERAAWDAVLADDVRELFHEKP